MTLDVVGSASGRQSSRAYGPVWCESKIPRAGRQGLTEAVAPLRAGKTPACSVVWWRLRSTYSSNPWEAWLAIVRTGRHLPLPNRRGAVGPGNHRCARSAAARSATHHAKAAVERRHQHVSAANTTSHAANFANRRRFGRRLRGRCIIVGLVVVVAIGRPVLAHLNAVE